jgi:hypothetical protein
MVVLRFEFEQVVRGLGFRKRTLHKLVSITGPLQAKRSNLLFACGWMNQIASLRSQNLVFLTCFRFKDRKTSPQVPSQPKRREEGVRLALEKLLCFDDLQGVYFVINLHTAEINTFG